MTKLQIFNLIGFIGLFWGLIVNSIPVILTAILVVLLTALIKAKYDIIDTILTNSNNITINNIDDSKKD